MEIVLVFFRWMHIFMGIIWIGLLYFFNFINGHVMASLDTDTKRKVIPELLPRALFWFRWGAAWTWISGLFLLMLVFYHGGQMFDDPGQGWNMGAIVMLVLTFAAVFVYDLLYKSPLGKKKKTAAIAGFVLIGGAELLMVYWGGYGYRALNIHIGAMFGTIMAFNVWFRIWPAQKTIIADIKNGRTPDAALVAEIGARSRHGAYLSVPLLWTMMNQHTVAFAGGAYGIPSRLIWVSLLAAIIVGWHVVFQFYRRSAKVPGF